MQVDNVEPPSAVVRGHDHAGTLVHKPPVDVNGLGVQRLVEGFQGELMVIEGGEEGVTLKRGRKTGFGGRVYLDSQAAPRGR